MEDGAKPAGADGWPELVTTPEYGTLHSRTVSMLGAAE
jgi:hypothetical protein